MTQRNRVTPLGDVVAIPLRGAWTGNRGRIHSGTGITKFHAGDLWITCALEYRGRWSAQWLPNHYTFLYFHDEAVSFAAGHRPCAECRRDAYNAYRAAWAAHHGDLPTAQEMNRRLHAERLIAGTHTRRLHALPWPELPDGTFVLRAGTPSLVLGGTIVDWTAAGYGPRRPRPGTGDADVITPPSSIAVLRAGYPVHIDPAALGEAPDVTLAPPGR
ncbi:hypothetical protein [Specibacter sp. RAF43]|uniref:hypothetical protein n=1 Tax=Specibacter sp. RAF43 TaxID=3233057 RepID=UPI003F955159